MDFKKEYFESTIVSLARYDSWIVIVVSCNCEKESRGGQRKKRYAYLYLKMLVPTTLQLIGTICLFVYFSEPTELEFPYCAGELKSGNKSNLQMEMGDTIFVNVPFTGFAYNTVHFEWFVTYLCSHLGAYMIDALTR